MSDNFEFEIYKRDHSYIHDMLRIRLLSICLVAATLTARTQQKIVISIDHNLEIINAITVGQYPEMLKDSSKDPYMFSITRNMRLAEQYFKPYKEHEAVVKASWLLKKFGTGIYLLPLYYERLPKIKRRIPIPKIIWSEISSNEDSALLVFDQFMRAAADFYHVSSFDKFQKQYKEVYLKSLEQAHNYLPDSRFIPLLENYYGDKKNGYQIILMPFFKADWGMGWETIEKNGKRNIYNIAAPFQQQNPGAEYGYDPGYGNASVMTNLCIHEFGHSFVNPLTAIEPQASAINKYADLYRPIPGAEQYTDWPTQFNEYIVRAGEIIVLRQLGDTANAEKKTNEYKEWKLLRFFVEQLTDYTHQRERFKTFADFAPELISRLKIIKNYEL